MHPQRVLREAGRRRRGVGRPMRRAGVVYSAGKERPEWGCHFMAIDVYDKRKADAGKQQTNQSLLHITLLSCIDCIIVHEHTKGLKYW